MWKWFLVITLILFITMMTIHRTDGRISFARGDFWPSGKVPWYHLYAMNNPMGIGISGGLFTGIRQYYGFPFKALYINRNTTGSIHEWYAMLDILRTLANLLIAVALTTLVYSFKYFRKRTGKII